MCIVVLKHVLGLSILTITLGDLMRKLEVPIRSLGKAKKAHTVSSSKGEMRGCLPRDSQRIISGHSLCL